MVRHYWNSVFYFLQQLPFYNSANLENLSLAQYRHTHKIHLAENLILILFEMEWNEQFNLTIIIIGFQKKHIIFYFF